MPVDNTRLFVIIGRDYQRGNQEKGSSFSLSSSTQCFVIKAKPLEEFQKRAKQK